MHIEITRKKTEAITKLLFFLLTLAKEGGGNHQISHKLIGERGEFSEIFNISNLISNHVLFYVQWTK